MTTEQAVEIIKLLNSTHSTIQIILYFVAAILGVTVAISLNKK
jgi:hypothetical protein